MFTQLFKNHASAHPFTQLLPGNVLKDYTLATALQSRNAGVLHAYTSLHGFTKLHDYPLQIHNCVMDGDEEAGDCLEFLLQHEEEFWGSNKPIKARYILPHNINPRDTRCFSLIAKHYRHDPDVSLALESMARGFMVSLYGGPTKNFYLRFCLKYYPKDSFMCLVDYCDSVEMAREIFQVYHSSLKQVDRNHEMLRHATQVLYVSAIQYNDNREMLACVREFGDLSLMSGHEQWFLRAVFAGAWSPDRIDVLKEVLSDFPNIEASKRYDRLLHKMGINVEDNAPPFQMPVDELIDQILMCGSGGNITDQEFVQLVKEEPTKKYYHQLLNYDERHHAIWTLSVKSPRTGSKTAVPRHRMLHHHYLIKSDAALNPEASTST